MSGRSVSTSACGEPAGVLKMRPESFNVEGTGGFFVHRYFVRFFAMAMVLSASCGSEQVVDPELTAELVFLTAGAQHSCGLTASGAALRTAEP